MANTLLTPQTTSQTTNWIETSASGDAVLNVANRNGTTTATKLVPSTDGTGIKFEGQCYQPAGR